MTAPLPVTLRPNGLHNDRACVCILQGSLNRLFDKWQAGPTRLTVDGTYGLLTVYGTIWARRQINAHAPIPGPLPFLHTESTLLDDRGYQLIVTAATPDVLWGAACGPRTGAYCTVQAAKTRFEGELGKKLPVARTFNRGWGDDAMAYGPFADDRAKGRKIVYSVKNTAAYGAMGRGEWDTRIDALLRSIADSGGGWFCLQHEPEDDIRDGHFTLVDWRAATERVISRAHAIAPTVKVGPILMSWTFDERSGRNIDDYLFPDADFIGADCYSGRLNPTTNIREPVVPLCEMIAAPLTAAKGMGVGLVVAELGIGKGAPGKLEWLEAAATTDLTGVEALCWFQANTGPFPEGFFIEAPEDLAAFARLII